MTEEELTEGVADRIWNMERMFNVRESEIRRDGDMPPQRFYEPCKLGPLKGRKVEKADYEKALDEYYGYLDWKKDGTPSKKALIRLGLDKEPSHLA